MICDAADFVPGIRDIDWRCDDCGRWDPTPGYGGFCADCGFDLCGDCARARHRGHRVE